MADDWITVSEASEVSGYRDEHITRLIRGGKLKARKVAIVWLVSKSSLREYLKRQEKRGEKRGPKPSI